MRILYLMLIITLLAPDLRAQSNGSIGGVITSADGSPAEFVSVSLKGTTKGTVADRKGRYIIGNVQPGTYTLVASFVGLESQEREVTVIAGERAQTDFVLKESAQQLQEIIISENKDNYKADGLSSSLRLKTSILETPQNIQVVTKDVIRDQQIISMSDGLVRNVSGAVRMEHWADMYTNITFRGSQIQAFRNGFNVVNSFWGPLTEDMSFVDHIEFVKGPAGFMLSNGDPSGLYNVVTKKPTGRESGEVAFTVGSFDLYRTSLDLDGKLSKDGKLLYKLNLAAQNKRTHRANEFNNRYVIAPVISYQVDEKTKLTAEYTVQLANMSNVGSYYVFSPDGFATLPVDATQLPGGLPATKMKDHSVFLTLNHQFNPDWSLTAQVSRFVYKQDGASMWPSVVNPDGTMIRNVSSWEAASGMTMAQVFVNGEVKTGGVRHRILSGVDLSNKEYFADWGQSHDLDTVGAEFDPRNPNLGPPVNGYPAFDFSTPLEQRATAIGGTINQRTAGFYVQDELGFIDGRLRLTIAGRYTYIRQADWGGNAIINKHVTPRVGLSYSINSSTSVYALYDQAFIPQAGNLSSGGDVKPITGNNTEFGIKRDWADGRWNTTIAAYRILKNNELTADPNAPPASGLSVELGQKRSQGIEFDIRGSIVNGLNVVANYAYTDSRVTKVTEGIPDVEKGDIVPGYAKHTVNTWLGYKIPSGALKGVGFSAGFMLLTGRETYWDPSPDPNQNLPTYFKLDAGVFWEKDNVRIAANMFNVLDEYLYNGSYYAWLSAYNWQTDAPRNVRLSLNYRF